MSKAKQESVSNACDMGMLQAYMDNALSPLETKELEAHLESCESCAQELAEAQESTPWLLQKVRSQQPEDIPVFSFEELYQQLEPQEGPAPSTQKPSFMESFSQWLGTWRWDFATAFALCLLLILPVTQQMFTQDTPLEHFNTPSPRRKATPQKRKIDKRQPTKHKLNKPGQATPKKLRRHVPPRKRKVPGVIAKGWSAHMHFGHRIGPGHYEKTQEVQDGQVLYPEDVVQFSYKTTQPKTLMIVGINAQGEVFPLILSSQKTSVTLKTLFGTLPKGRSFFMDDYVGQERYFVITSSKTFTWQAVQKALKGSWQTHKDLKKLKELPGPWEIRTWWLTKRKRSTTKKVPQE